MPETVPLESKGVSQQQEPGSGAQKNRRILIIDDNRAIHEDFRKVLIVGSEQATDLAAQESLLFGGEVNAVEGLGFEVDSAFQGQEGLEFVKRSQKDNNPYAMAFVDIRMPPGWDGIKTVGHIWEVCPELQICLCTAFSDYSWEEILEHLDTRDRLLFLKKPFDNTEVRQLACTLTEKWNLNREVNQRLADLNQLVEEQTVELKEKNIQLQKDLTARKYAEEREASLGRILDSSLNEIYFFDSESYRLIHVNKSARDNLGYSMDELKQMTPADLSAEKNIEDIAQLVAPLRIGDKFKIQMTGLNRRKDGSVYPLELHIQMGSLGSQHLFVVMAIDIAEREKSEKERLGLEEQLRQAQKMEAIGQLAGGVAHDFNNMLQVISGYVDLVQSELPEGSSGRKKLEHVSKAAARAKGLTSQLLAYSRRQVLQSTFVEVNQLVSRVLEMVKRLIGENIEVEFNPNELEGGVKADPGQLEQALMNLCLNARDSMMDGGRLIVKTQSVEFDRTFCSKNHWAKKGRFVELVVSDNGMGISKENLEHVFEPFFTTKGVGKGSGLGLSMVHGVFNQQGGMVNVLSHEGDGTTFLLYLPLFQGEFTPEAEGVVEHQVPRGRETVLLAEDEPMVRQFVLAALTQAGYRVILAQDGVEAVEKFKEHGDEIDLVLMDVMMPKMNGIKARKKIMEVDPKVRTLLASGYSAEEVGKSAVEDEHIPFLQKPFEVSNLLFKVRELLDDGNNGIS